MNSQTVVQSLKNAKHRAWIVKKHVKRRKHTWDLRRRDAVLARKEQREPFQYDPSRYENTFLARPDVESVPGAPVPRVIYACWMGGTLTPARRRSIDQLRRVHRQVDFRLVTEENLHQVVLDEHPLHPAFPHLSPLHKSDYLRIYLMHFHGGGYTDVKETLAAWTHAFDVVDRRDDVYAVGYREISATYTADLPWAVGHDVKRHYRALLGPSAFIMRPQSPLTGEWWRELQRRMDYYAPALAEAPAPDRPYSRPAGYPIPWSELVGDTLHQLSLKYQQNIVFDPLLQPKLWDHR